MGVSPGAGNPPLRLTAAYALFAGVWILVSDSVVSWFVSDPVLVRDVGIAKGWIFVAVTSALLYAMARRQQQQWRADAARRQELEQRLRRFLRIVEQSPVSIVLTDPSGAIEYVNEKFVQVTGYTRDEALGQNPRILKSGETPPGQYAEMWRQLAAGHDWQGEFHNRRKNGELFWERALVAPLVDEDGALQGYMALKEDITALKALEGHMRESQRLEAIGTLAGGVAHDFNNILTIIQGNAALLADPAVTPGDQREALEQILQAGTRAEGLTRQLLLFSRRHAMQMAPLDVNDVVLSLAKLMRRLLGENVVFDTRCAAGLPRVMADRGMIEQVLVNLAVNGRDAMPNGGRLVVATSLSQVEPEAAREKGMVVGPSVVLTVSDQGTGIPPSVLPHIFEPFFTTKAVGKGTGLGLATAYGIVQQHHGWIGVDSVAGEGTTFQVWLPATDAAAVTAHDGPSPAPVGGQETVLVVEDEPAVRRMVAGQLRQLGYTVHEAESADRAMSVWDAHWSEIDLLVTDLAMPGRLNGVQLHAALRERRADLRVLFMSGHPGRVDVEGMVFEPGVNFIAKPFRGAELAAAVRRRLDAAD